MPTTDASPADGTTTTAAAQVLVRRNLIIRAADGGGDPEYPEFAPTGFLPINLRDVELALQVNNLSSLWINLFLFPTFDRGDFVFRAQNNIEWRPVFQMPGDTFPSDFGTASAEWLPMTSPMILPVAVPVSFKCCCVGMDRLSIEIRILSVEDLAEDQGENRILFSLSAQL